MIFQQQAMIFQQQSLIFLPLQPMEPQSWVQSGQRLLERVKALQQFLLSWTIWTTNACCCQY